MNDKNQKTGGQIGRTRYHAIGDMQGLVHRLRQQQATRRAAPGEAVLCAVCAKPVGGDSLSLGICGCGLLARERAALALAAEEGYADRQVGVDGSAILTRVMAGTGASTLAESSRGIDLLLVADPVVPVGPGTAQQWHARLAAGGRLLLNLGRLSTADDWWPLLDQLRGAGFTDLALVDGWDPSSGIVGDELVFATARRQHSQPERRPVGRSPVSVIIPLYNHEKYIEAALESVFTQTRPPEEVIVIDDGSTDGSAELASRLCARYPGAVFWGHPNRGAHNTINTGLMRATQPVLAILNSDDIFHHRRLERSLAVMEAEGATVIASHIGFIDEDGQKNSNPWYEEVITRWQQIGNMSLALLNGNFIMTTSNLLLDRRVLQEVGYFHDFRYAHDLDFFVRMISAGHPIRLMEEVLLDYRYHPGNTIKENHTKVRVEWAFICALAMRLANPNLSASLDRWEFIDQLNGIAQNHNLLRGILFILQAMSDARPAERLDMSLFSARPGLYEKVYRSL